TIWRLRFARTGISGKYGLTIRRESNFTCDLAKLLDHSCRHFLHGHHARELVRFGKEIAFERACRRIEIRDKGCIRLRDLTEVLGRSKARRFYGSGDVEHRVALGNDYRVQVDVAAAKALLNVDDVGPFIKKVFPGFKGSSTMNVAPQNKCFLAANDS